MDVIWIAFLAWVGWHLVPVLIFLGLFAAGAVVLFTWAAAMTVYDRLRAFGKRYSTKKVTDGMA